MFLVPQARLDEKGTVGLVSSILTVREVVTDQLGINTGSVLTTEVSRLLHLPVEVEVEISTTLVQEIPAVFSQGNNFRLVGEGKYLFLVISVNYLPSVGPGGENHPRRSHSQQLRLRLENIEPVYVTLGTNSRQLWPEWSSPSRRRGPRLTGAYGRSYAIETQRKAENSSISGFECLALCLYGIRELV